MEYAYKVNDTLTIADAYKVKGIVQKNFKDTEQAEELLENSLRLNQDFGNEYNLSESSLEIRDL